MNQLPPEYQPASASASDVVEGLVACVGDDTMSADDAIGFVQTSMRSQLAVMISNEEDEIVRCRVSQYRSCNDRNLLTGSEPAIRIRPITTASTGSG